MILQMCVSCGCEWCGAVEYHLSIIRFGGRQSEEEGAIRAES